MYLNYLKTFYYAGRRKTTERCVYGRLPLTKVKFSGYFIKKYLTNKKQAFQKAV